MGSVEFLAKPFSRLTLAAKVREVLDKPHIAESPSTQTSLHDMDLYELKEPIRIGIPVSV